MKISKIIILKEKHGDIYIVWPESTEEQEILAKSIVEGRIEESWYPKEELTLIQQLLDKKTALAFLRSRSNYEYEDFEIEEVKEKY